MPMLIGSNLIRETNGILIVDGKEQIALETNIGQALLSMEIYDESQEHIAKLRKNAWVFNKDQWFSITTNPDHLTLINDDIEETVLEARVERDGSKIWIVRGHFYTTLGEEVTITPEELQIGGRTFRDAHIVATGSAIVITSGGLSAG